MVISWVFQTPKETLGKDSKKKTANYPHFVDKRFPPSLSTSAEGNYIHTKEFFHPHSLTLPPSALIPFYWF